MKKQPNTVSPWDYPLLLEGHRVIDYGAFDQFYKPLGYVEVSRIQSEKGGKHPEERVVMSPPEPKDRTLPNALPITDEVRDLVKDRARELTRTMEQHADLRSRFADAVVTINLLTQSALRRQDAESVGMVAELALLAGQSLSQLEGIRPQAFAPIARKHIQWPMMRSTHTRNSDSEELLRDIALGSGYPITLDMGAKWKPDAAAGIALRMIIHLSNLRSDHPESLIDGKLVRNCLPPLTRATAGKWWGVGLRFLLDAYPSPCKVKELNQLVTATTKQRYESSRNQAIQDKIKARFMAIAKR